MFFSDYHLVEEYPSIDIYSSDDSETLTRLSGFLEKLYYKNETHKSVSVLKLFSYDLKILKFFSIGFNGA